MSLKSLMARLQSRAADTSDTPEKNMGYQRKAPIHAGCTRDTPDTLHFLVSCEMGKMEPAGLAEKTMAQAEEQAKAPVASNEVSIPVSTELAEIPDPDRWCWPHSSAMTGREIETMVERTVLFYRRGFPALEAELLADKLVTRDRDYDDRRLCLECAHLAYLAGAWRCAQWQRAGLVAPSVSADLALMLQRCEGFKNRHERSNSCAAHREFGEDLWHGKKT